MKPAVSIIIPCYNYARYLADAVNSILSQTYTNWEAIVVDDGSTDATCEVATSFRDPRIRYIYQENQGESAARNRGGEEARGEYLAFLDADDIWFPQKLSKQIALLEENPDVSLAFCDAEYVDGRSRLLPGPSSDRECGTREVAFEDLCLGNKVGGGSVAVVRKSLWEQVGGFDREIQFGEDWDFYLRAALVTRVVGLTEPLVRVRVHRGGQWRFPRPDTVDRVLEDHLRLLQRAFSLWSSAGPPADDRRDRAIAREYAQASWASYAFGRTGLAREHLHKALSLDPETWSDPSEIAAAIAQTGSTLIQMHPKEPKIVRRYVETVLDHLPERLSGTLVRGPVEAQAHVEVGYHFDACGKHREARRHILRGVFLDPVWLSNRGTLALALGLVLGKQPVKFARRVLAGGKDA